MKHSLFLQFSPLFLLLCSFTLPALSSTVFDSTSRNESINVNARRKKCSFRHEFCSLGDHGFLVSPKYPKNYPSRADCTYDIRSPPGTRMTIVCTEFNLQPSFQCEQDRFTLFNERKRKRQFVDIRDLDFELDRYDERFCDQVEVRRETSGNRMRASFRSGHVTPSPVHPYRFNCTITVVEDRPQIQQTQQQNPQQQHPGPAQIQMEEEDLQNQCSCGVRNWEGEGKRIVGGTNALIGEFPWRCMLYSERLGAFCGCSLLSNRWVLTAAHCTSAVEEGDVVYVDLGDYDLATIQETNNTVVKVAEIIQHRKYSPQTQDFDISLLKLDRPVEYTNAISSICLPWRMRRKTFHGTTVTASGWGSSVAGGPISNVLQTVDLPVLTTQECRQYYGDPITENMICTYAKGKDSCQGDSGSSIDYYDKVTNRYYAIGIVSWGVGCAAENDPGVYLKITNFLDWIQLTTGDTFCKP